MNFNRHYNLVGRHALLGASNYHWLNYTDEKLVSVLENLQAKELGTKLHDFAKTCIELGQKLPRSTKTLNMYVNDAIGFKMTPEQIVYYSDNCFGTCDAISFRDKILRIHDLKTGVTQADMRQLKIYAALFCLEYGINPNSIRIELRIYQSNKVEIAEPSADEILEITNRIIRFDKIINNMNDYEGVA